MSGRRSDPAVKVLDSSAILKAVQYLIVSKGERNGHPTTCSGTVDTFNDRSFREKAKDMMDPNVVIIDGPTSQELRGPDGYVQFSEGFVMAIPDLKGTALEHKVSGNKVTSRVRGRGNFTGTLQTPQGSMPGTGNPVDIVYQVEQEFNDEGKIVRFVIDYDMQDFMRQLGAG